MTTTLAPHAVPSSWPVRLPGGVRVTAVIHGEAHAVFEALGAVRAAGDMRPAERGTEVS